MADLSTVQLTQLVPSSRARVPLRGLYLDLLEGETPDDGRVFCFSNFVMSLDGRISISEAPAQRPQGVPSSLANPADWRLFQELVAQSDAVLVSGRYVREVAGGHAEPLVQLTAPGMSDLPQWRSSRELPPQPEVVIVSSSLDIDPAAARRLGERIVVITGRSGGSERRTALVEAGIEVRFAGDDEDVAGERLASVLAELGYRAVYAAAGPVVLRLLIAAGVLDRLFVTTVNRLLGGERFATLVEGHLFDAPVDVRLDAMYLDDESLETTSQTFAVYRITRRR